MNAENLRETYNRYFSSPSNTWSSTDIRKTQKVADQTISWLVKFGHRKGQGKMLDVGCANGYYTEAFRKRGYQAHGLDYSEVALEHARQKFPLCEFIQMNGFEPQLKVNYDLIFCRGFSGVNTHDLSFISGWINKYLTHLSPNGFFVLGYSSDFSGREKKSETVNHSREELDHLVKMIEGKYCDLLIFHYFGIVSQIKKQLMSLILKKKAKEYFYLIIQKK